MLNEADFPIQVRLFLAEVERFNSNNLLEEEKKRENKKLKDLKKAKGRLANLKRFFMLGYRKKKYREACERANPCIVAKKYANRAILHLKNGSWDEARKHALGILRTMEQAIDKYAGHEMQSTIDIFVGKTKDFLESC